MREVLNGAPVVVEAHRREIIPALRFACGRHGMVFIEERDLENGTIAYELSSIRDEPGRLIATPVDDGTWSFQASIGRFGDREREAALLTAFGERLRAVRAAGY